jgi:hypothetical protein
VECAEIRQGFLTGDVPSGSSVDEHVSGCPQCRELFRNGAALGRGLAGVARQASAPDDQFERVEAVLANERGLRAFLRSRSTRMRWLLSLSLPALLLLRELAHKRVPWRSLGSLRIVAGVVLVGLLALVLRAALRPLPIERRAARLRSALAIGAWCLPFLLGLVPDAQASGQEWTPSFALRCCSCFFYGSALAVPSFALLWALERGDPVPFRVWALGAGVVALVANLVLLLHCPVTNRVHLLAGHLSIGLSWFAAVCVREWWSHRA